MRKVFRVGDRVEKTMGIYLIGTVIEPFFWKESTDGTYKAPSVSDIPVLWDGGMKGYANKAYLKVKK